MNTHIGLTLGGGVGERDPECRTSRLSPHGVRVHQTPGTSMRSPTRKVSPAFVLRVFIEFHYVGMTD